jgi:hypothetical protein
MGQTALEVGFASVLHRTGVCGCARVCVCISGIFITRCKIFCKYEYAYGRVCARVCMRVCVMRSNLLLEFFFPLLFQFIYYLT